MTTLSLTSLVTAAALTIGLPTVADAQRHGERWNQGHPNAQVQHPRASDVPLRVQRHGYHTPRGQAQRHHGAQVHPPRGPAIQSGTNARHYQRVDPHAGYRMGHPPRGHHYRHSGGTVYLVEDQSLQVIAVIGLLSALLR